MPAPISPSESHDIRNGGVRVFRNVISRWNATIVLTDMNEPYILYFDLNDQPFVLFNSIFLWLIIPIYTGAVILIMKALGHLDRIVLSISALGLIALSMLTPFFIEAYEAEILLRSRLTSNLVNTVEGSIANFQPLSIGGRGHESFSVNGQKFQYTGSEAERIFKTTRENRLMLLQNGNLARIKHLGGRILRIEIKENQPRH